VEEYLSGRSTANKLLVLIATYNGGGSGTFYTLHILDVSGQRAFDMDGDVYQRINVTSVRNVALGDRGDGDVKISGNTILVTTIRDGPADTSGASKTKRIKATRP
jgi:predicted RNA-binding protein with TRAM domain